MARKLKVKQLGPWCSFCEAKVRAVYRDTGFRKFSCEAHKHLIDNMDATQRQQNSYMTEGEFQAFNYRNW